MKVFPLFFVFLTTSLIAQDKDYEKSEYYPLLEQGLPGSDYWVVVL